jgi:hypothetical protein
MGLLRKENNVINGSGRADSKSLSQKSKLENISPTEKEIMDEITDQFPIYTSKKPKYSIIIPILPSHNPFLRQAPKSAPTTRHPLSEIVRAFKAYSSQKINRLRNSQGMTSWQDV